MKTTCTQCKTSETARKDGVCPNCNVIRRFATFYQQPTEENIIKRLGAKCVDCGIADLIVLKLVLGGGHAGGIVCPRNAHGSMLFCERVSADPTGYLIRCHNCQARFHTSGGRPPKYSSEEERMAAQHEQRTEYKLGRRLKAMRLLGNQCTVCRGVPEVIYWTGDGTVPKRSKDWVVAQILRDPEFAQQFTLFCSVCQPVIHFARAQRVEVEPASDESTWG